MPVFEYKAINQKGRKISGIVTADGPVAARLKLSQDLLLPVEIKEVSEIVRASLFESLASRLSHFRRVDPAEVSASTRQLATLVSSGLPLVECLSALTEQTEQSYLKKIYTQIREKVVEGEALSKAMAEHPSVFDPIFVNMVRAAETGGALDVILKRLADFSEQRLKLKKKISAAMTYPVFMLCISAIILIFLMSFVMPKVMEVFRGMNLALPWTTRALVWFTEQMRHSWWLVVLGIIAAGTLFSAWKRTDRGTEIWDRVRLRTPFFGKLHRKAVVGRFTRTLAILLRSGLPLVQALETARLSIGNRIIEEQVQKTARLIGEGADFATPLKNSGQFPPLVVQLVRAGEQSGELETMLEKAAEVYEDDVESLLTSIAALIEPLIILGMGFVVAFIVIAVLLPIFDMSGGIRGFR